MRTMELLLTTFVTLCVPVAGIGDEPSGDGQQARWNSMLEAKKLGKWEVLKKVDFANHGAVGVQRGEMRLGAGQPATGVRWTGEFPRNNYEIQLEAKRTEGKDFFCGLTFPVREGALTLILGGWGGEIVGLSCLDGLRAVENSSVLVVPFQQDRWYSVRLRVDDTKIRVWLDEKLVIDESSQDYECSVTYEVEPCLPLGIATWYTSSAIRKIRYRKLP